MKTKRKLFSLCVGLVCLTVLPIPAISEEPSVPGTPPKRIDGEPEATQAVAMVYQYPTDVQVVFLEDSDNVQLEVRKEDNTPVYQGAGSATAYSQLVLDARGWKGRYTIRVKMKKLNSTIFNEETFVIEVK